jgi:hypothetical protein
MANAKTCIVVLGMHRCGTSAIMGTIHRMGVPIGSRFLVDLYEHPACIDFNEKLLSSVGVGWDDPGPIDPDWWQTSQVERFRHDLSSMVRLEFGSYMLWAVKDPRMCITLPVWLPVFAELGIKPLFIIPFRQPTAVAESHVKRDGFSGSKSLVLWMKHMLTAELYSRGFQRLIMRYSDLLIDAESAVLRIESHFNIHFPRRWHQAAKDVNAFVNPHLNHHYLAGLNGMDAFPDEFREAASLFDKVCEAGCQEENCLHEFDRIRERFNQWQNIFMNQDVLQTLETVHRLRHMTYHHLTDYGMVLINQRLFEQACRLFQDVTELFPQSSSAWNNLGIAWEQLGEWAQAVDCFQRAVAIDCNYEIGLGNLKRLSAARNHIQPLRPAPGGIFAMKLMKEG